MKFIEIALSTFKHFILYNLLKLRLNAALYISEYFITLNIHFRAGEIYVSCHKCWCKSYVNGSRLSVLGFNSKTVNMSVYNAKKYVFRHYKDNQNYYGTSGWSRIMKLSSSEKNIKTMHLWLNPKKIISLQ